MSDIKLLHGDCLELMKDIPDKSIDMVCCDLPYGSTSCAWDSIIPFDKLWYQYERITKDSSAIVLFCQQPFTTRLIASNLKLFKYCWIWDKHYAGGFLNAKKQPLKRTEDIAVFYKQQCIYNPQMRSGTYRTKGCLTLKPSTCYGKHTAVHTNNDLYYPTNILDFVGETKSARFHPTQKPVELLEYLIRTYTNENETVLDNCMGSGSTGVACLNTNRNFIGMELDDNYFHIAEERIKQAQINPEVPYRKPSNDGVKHKRLF